MESTKSSRRTATNTGRTAKNPNADLLYGVARAYGCWRVAEVTAVSLVTSG